MKVSILSLLKIPMKLTVLIFVHFLVKWLIVIASTSIYSDFEMKVSFSRFGVCIAFKMDRVSSLKCMHNSFSVIMDIFFCNGFLWAGVIMETSILHFSIYGQCIKMSFIESR